jgi:endonuclease/exonuclease/phosphatase family metal-dependent hydrolase
MLSLRATRSGKLVIVATGRGDWVGWVELKTEPVNAEAIANTGRVMGLVDADILAVIEAESRPALLRFSELLLPQVSVKPYDHIMLVDGNDDRGIDVGLLTRDAWPIRTVVSHVDDRDGSGNRLFSRDCLELEIGVPGGGSIWLLVNHLKSQGYGSAAQNDARRLRQATRVREIYEARVATAEFVAILGDFNDTPDSDPLAPLFKDGKLRDVSKNPKFKDDGRPGTWRNGTAANKLDYVVLSPALWDRVTSAGVERRGVWGGTKGTLFPHLPEITKQVEAASDHAAIWVDLDLDLG